jgi:phosphoglycolate phosphatase
MLKAIIFDFDGVIADTFDLSIGINREVNRFISKKNFRDHHDGNIFEQSVIKFSEEQTEYWLKRYHELAEERHFFPLKRQIKMFSSKNKLFIISSSAERSIKKYLKLGHADGYFKKILGRDTHRSKIEKFKMIFKKYKIKPSECVFVTDTLGDLREAKKVGVPTIAVTWGYHGKTRLKRGKPDAMIHDFKELAIAINKIRKAV